MPETPDSPEQLFLQNLPLIERVIAWTCRRNLRSADEAEDFASVVRLKLVENDYAILRKFEGRSSLRTFLTITIQRLFQDYRNHRWGKWRPCEEAKRLGPVAVELDQLLSRDGHTFHEACEILLTNLKADTTVQELEEIAARLPARAPRPKGGDDQLRNLAAHEPQPDEQLFAKEKAEVWRRIVAALDKARSTLPPEDQLVLKMRFEAGLQVSTIARTLCLDQKQLYRRLEMIEKHLREELGREGITLEQVLEALGRKGGPGPSL